jgi:hypothetical protein
MVMRTWKPTASIMIGLCCVGLASSQRPAPHSSKDDIYAVALSASLEKMHHDYGNINDSSDTQVRTDYTHMIVRDNPEITDALPTQFGNFNVQYLNDRGLIERFSRVRKEFAVLAIHPIHAEGARLRLQISMEWFSYRSSRLAFGISDWSDVYFDFDCVRNQYVVSEVKLGGI